MLLVPARLIDVNGFQRARPTWPIGGTDNMPLPLKPGIGGEYKIFQFLFDLFVIDSQIEDIY